MEFAFVDGQRREAEPKLAGTCPICGKPMIPKCGSKILWHWAHHGRKYCDHWWENETDWHRAWKNFFPKAWHEQVHFDENGEKHVADVKTNNGIVLEFQNSAMSTIELLAREQFYGRMVWILNGSPFKNQFQILGRLPADTTSWAADIVFCQQYSNYRGRAFWRKSENPEYKSSDLVQIHDVREIQNQIDNEYIGHHFYDWQRPRSVWFESTMPVYIDFGGDLLWNIHRYRDSDLRCVKAVKKMSLIFSLGGDYSEFGEVNRASTRPRRNGDPVYEGQDEIILGQIR